MHRSSDPFEYVGYQIHPESSRLVCRYRIGAEEFCEEFTFPTGGDWDGAAAQEAARWLFLLAGVSYYKTGAPAVIDLGDVPVSDEDRAFLRDYYLHGMGEFAYRLREHHPDDFSDGLDLRDLQLVGGRTDVPAPVATPAPRTGLRPLIPFGGGLDSIVSVGMLAGKVTDPALFIVNRPGDRFEAIETPAAATGLPIVRAERAIDAKVLQSKDRGYLNGHVPVTGIISAMAVLSASLFGYDAVVMSNEWSSSSATLTLGDGREVNHQYSKSAAFERAFAARLQTAGLPDYFSLLRPFTELWIAKFFAENTASYLTSFRSCNRSFAIDPTKRVDHWCGVCDKCAFIDLIVAPFVPTEALSAVFRGNEPLQNPQLERAFEQLMGLDSDLKPWECVGDVVESRVAMRLIAQRPDRSGAMIETLSERAAQFDDPAADALLVPVGDHGIPERYATLIDLV